MSLPCYRRIFSDLVNEDGLLVMAQGIGLRVIISKFLKLYCSGSQLVIVLNAKAGEGTLYRDMLLADGIQEERLPVLVDAGTNATARKSLYARGGVLFISARIAIVDILCGRLETSSVAGFLVVDAHRVQADGNDAHSLKIFREANSSGFIKAFSDDPETLTAGFNRMENTLRTLRVGKLFLYPRFQAFVMKDLDGKAPEVIEYAQAQTPLQATVQRALLDAMDACLAVIRATTKIDVDELTLENGLFESFDVMIRRRLDKVWNTVSPRAKTHLYDLTTLRKLLGYLTRYDAVSFYTFLDMQRIVMLAAQGSSGSKGNNFQRRKSGGAAGGAGPGGAGQPPNAPFSTDGSGQRESSWLLTPAGERVFRAAKARIFACEPVDPRQQQRSHAPSSDAAAGAAAAAESGSSSARPSSIATTAMSTVVELDGDDDDFTCSVRETNAAAAAAAGDDDGAVIAVDGDTVVAVVDDDKTGTARRRRRSRNGTSSGKISGNNSGSGNGIARFLLPAVPQTLDDITIVERVRSIITPPATAAARRPHGKSAVRGAEDSLADCRVMRLAVVLERNPKWTLLQDVIREIRAEAASARVTPSTPGTTRSGSGGIGLGSHSGANTLITVRDERTAYLLRDILRMRPARGDYASAMAAAVGAAAADSVGPGGPMMSATFARYVLKEAGRTRNLRAAVLNAAALAAPPPGYDEYIEQLASLPPVERDLLLAADLPGWEDAVAGGSTRPASSSAAAHAGTGAVPPHSRRKEASASAAAAAAAVSAVSGGGDATDGGAVSALQQVLADLGVAELQAVDDDVTIVSSSSGGSGSGGGRGRDEVMTVSDGSEEAVVRAGNNTDGSEEVKCVDEAQQQHAVAAAISSVSAGETASGSRLPATGLPRDAPSAAAAEVVVIDDNSPMKAAAEIVVLDDNSPVKAAAAAISAACRALLPEALNNDDVLAMNGETLPTSATAAGGGTHPVAGKPQPGPSAAAARPTTAASSSILSRAPQVRPHVLAEIRLLWKAAAVFMRAERELTMAQYEVTHEKEIQRVNSRYGEQQQQQQRELRADLEFRQLQTAQAVSLTSLQSEDDDQLQRAIAASSSTAEDDALRRAIVASRTTAAAAAFSSSHASSAAAHHVDAFEEIDFTRVSSNDDDAVMLVEDDALNDAEIRALKGGSGGTSSASALLLGKSKRNTSLEGARRSSSTASGVGSAATSSAGGAPVPPRTSATVLLLDDDDEEEEEEEEATEADLVASDAAGRRLFSKKSEKMPRAAPSDSLQETLLNLHKSGAGVGSKGKSKRASSADPGARKRRKSTGAAAAAAAAGTSSTATAGAAASSSKQDGPSALRKKKTAAKSAAGAADAAAGGDASLDVPSVAPISVEFMHGSWDSAAAAAAAADAATSTSSASSSASCGQWLHTFGSGGGGGRVDIVLYPLSRLDARMPLLPDLNPAFVIQFDPDPAFTRELEVHNALGEAALQRAADATAAASAKGAAPHARSSAAAAATTSLAPSLRRVYFLVTSSSAEEQRYLSALKKERAAFARLVSEKANMAPPPRLTTGAATAAVTDPLAIRKGTPDEWGITYDTSREGLAALMGRDGGIAGALSALTGGRAGAVAGGGAAKASEARPLTVDIGTEDRGKRVVVVDMREFRSKLPMRMHVIGLELKPVTLEVGDFVLSPDICVERKSVPDLIGSLASGRLYSQAEAMTRAYRKPMLAVEFDEDRPFSLLPNNAVPADIEIASPISKLVLLTLHFPSLRILWCRTPSATALYFAALKQNQPEPDPDAAAAIASDGVGGVVAASSSGGGGDCGEEMRNLAALEMLRKLPGVNATNVRSLAAAVSCFADVARLSEERLGRLLGVNNAALLCAFLHSTKNSSSL